jgi:hypothetical protein
MSTLISASNLLVETDALGVIYSDLIGGIDPARIAALGLASAETSSIFSSDPSQLLEWLPYTAGMYGGSNPPGGTSISSGFGPSGGFAGGGAFGSGLGLLSRGAVLPSVFKGKFDSIIRELAKYGAQVSSTIIDLGTFAAYYNGVTAYTVLFSPDSAAAFAYAYNLAQQLPAACVFAPQGIVLGSLSLTGGAPGTWTAGIAFPFANAYTSPSPTTDSGGNNVYVGAQPTAQGFAPIKNTAAVVTTTISGTCVVTVTAHNQAGVSETFTATLSSDTAGTSVNLSPSTSGDRIGGQITAVTFSGTATSGVISIQTGVPERSGT